MPTAVRTAMGVCAVLVLTVGSPSAQTAGVAADGERALFEQQMNADMARMMHDMHGPGYTGDPDIDFLVMMIPHHQGAVDMARLALIHGSDPQTRAVAAGIIASQVTEIAAMKARLQYLLSESGSAEPPFPPLTGLRGSGAAQD